MRLRRLLPCMTIVFLAASVWAQDIRGTTEVTIKGKKISINYGRPSLRGRDLLSLAPVGMVWRLGMNQATEIETAADLMVGSTELKAGKYTLWLKKTGENSWTLAFHPKTGVWGLPELKEGYVAELPLKFAKAADSAEQVTITLSENKGNAVVKIQWGTLLLSGSIGVK
jgi:hypothetical protein